MLLFSSNVLNWSLNCITVLWNNVISIVNMVFELDHGNSIVQGIEIFDKWVSVVDF